MGFRAREFLRQHLVQLGSGDPPAPTLSLAAGLALIEAIEVVAPTQGLMLKWPNDLMLLGKKLAGILLERSGDRIVIGFGVNLATAPKLTDRRAATLGSQLGARGLRPVARRKLRAPPSALADNRELRAGSRLAGAGPSAGDETFGPCRQRRDDQRALWRTRPRRGTASHPRRRFDRGDPGRRRIPGLTTRNRPSAKEWQ